MKRIVFALFLILPACGGASEPVDSGPQGIIVQDSGPGDSGCGSCFDCCVAQATTLPDGGYGGQHAGLNYTCTLECSDGGS